MERMNNCYFQGCMEVDGVEPVKGIYACSKHFKKLKSSNDIEEVLALHVKRSKLVDNVHNDDANKDKPKEDDSDKQLHSQTKKVNLAHLHSEDVIRIAKAEMAILESEKANSLNVVTGINRRMSTDRNNGVMILQVALNKPDDKNIFKLLSKQKRA